MLCGINNSGKRTEPLHSGEIANCPFCGSEIKAYCGEINIWHWRHTSLNNCDSWSEGETEWHLTWKMKFPSECREVIIESDGIKHRADIRTKAGLIIEFQHSPISSSEIHSREFFYDNMIWVLDFSSSNNFLPWSKVNKHLKDLEIRNAEERKAYDTDRFTSFDQNEINQKENEFSSENSTLRFLKTEFDQLKNYIEGQKQFFTKMYLDWRKNLSNSVLTSLYLFTEDGRKEYNSIKIALEASRSSLNVLTKELLQINNLNVFVFNDVIYFEVPYKQINPINFALTVAISKDTFLTIFPESIFFQSEKEFKDFSYRKETFVFGFNKTELILRYNRKLEIAKSEVKVNILKVKDFRQKKFSEFEIYLNKEMHSISLKISESENNLNILFYELQSLIERQKNKEANRILEQEQLEKEWGIRLQNQKSRIMKEWKGLYGYSWKYKRKSWNSAEKTIYIDPGGNFLFEILNEHSVKKISKYEFLKLYNI